MKAVQVVKYGDAVEGIELREVPEPAAPKSGEALVGVEFSPINFNDLMVVWGIYSWRPELPATMGNEGAGKVVAVGEGVRAVKVGDRVILSFTVRKWQQRVLVPAEELIVVPPDADPQQAAMMAINPVTVALLLDQYVAPARRCRRLQRCDLRTRPVVGSPRRKARRAPRCRSSLTEWRSF
jgi:NADPH:quinone reductase-like Zn-dependent oxidoreductase